MFRFGGNPHVVYDSCIKTLDLRSPRCPDLKGAEGLSEQHPAGRTELHIQLRTGHGTQGRRVHKRHGTPRALLFSVELQLCTFEWERAD
ncbi:hypothetical protein NQZ68_007075 [Dissostichus eleginoides]|nr:hypothetical protein NQZ68_007075 [Dissostichus eleginoides]